MGEEKIFEIGQVKHFFSKINVAVVDLAATLSVGDRILVKGPTTDVEMTVNSMQIEHKNIQKAEAGQSIGLKLNGPAKPKDLVYKIV
jgi:translation elongation factor EF-1alpha